MVLCPCKQCMDVDLTDRIKQHSLVNAYFPELLLLKNAFWIPAGCQNKPTVAEISVTHAMSCGSRLTPVGRALALSRELGIPGHAPITGTIHSALNYSGNAQILPGCGTLVVSGALSRNLFILPVWAWKVLIIVLQVLNDIEKNANY